ncbi:MAG: Crp/Fnr family transcriptional regulator [Ignavibacteria bacterium]|nr:Crp/Fnr family transcriptional regulator [Ignavibacteria bacterium]
MQSEELNDCSRCNVSLKSIFCELDKNALQTIYESKKNHTFKKGEVIYIENSYPRYLFCINSGKVKITQTGIEGNEHIMHIASEGELIGYRAILCGDKYTRTAVAMEDPSLCLIPVDIFLSCVKENQKVVFKVFQLFSKELQDAEKKVIDITQRPVIERISQSLLLLKESFGVESDGITLKIVIRRDELASLAGTTRETATRTLFELKSKQIIRLSGKKIQIINYEELFKSAKINFLIISFIIQSLHLFI